MTLAEAIAAFDLAVRADGLSDRTIAWYRMVLKRFAGHVGAQAEITTITRQTMREYVVTLRETEERYIGAANKPPQPGRMSPESVASHIRGLHRFWSFLAAEYGLPNAMLGIKRPKARTEIRAATAEDFVKMFNAASGRGRRHPHRDRAMLAFLADTACRLSAMLNLRVEQLDLKLCRAYVREKGGKLSALMFTPVTARLINIWLMERKDESIYVFTNGRGDRLTVGGYHTMLRILKAKAGVRGRVNPHSFRHAFAREYLKSGGDLATLSKLMNHSTINITSEQYAVFARNELAQFHDKFSPLPSLLEGLDGSDS